MNKNMATQCCNLPTGKCSLAALQDAVKKLLPHPTVIFVIAWDLSFIFLYCEKNNYQQIVRTAVEKDSMAVLLKLSLKS